VSDVRAIGMPGLAFFAALCASALAARPAGAEVRVRMGANTAEVSIASKFQVTVVIEGAEGEVEAPELRGDGFKVLNVSQRSSPAFSFNVGRRSLQSSLTFAYVLQPTRAGTIQILPVTVKVGGEAFQSTSGVKVEVQPIEPQDHLVLEITGPEKGQVYLDQEFTVTLKVFARRLSGRYADLDPFPSEGATWPRLYVPWFEAQEGFATEDFQKYANRLLSQGRGNSGFPINDLSRQDFFDRVPFRFKLTRSETKRVASDGREYSYFVYEIQKKFRAEKPGKFLFGAVLAKGHLGVDRPGGPEVIELIAQSEPLEVTVKSPPAEGRPPFFTGAIGRWTISAQVKPTKVVVGEPLTVSLTVSGDGLLENVGPPPLASQEGFAELFRIHDEPKTGVADAEQRSKVFTYGVRAKSSRVKALPPIAFAYFDPKEEKYVTVKTEPLPLEVQEGKSSGGEYFDLTRRGSEKSEVQVIAQTLYPIYEKPDALVAAAPPARFTGLQAAVLFAPPLAALLGLGLLTRHRRLRADPSLLRARRAHRRAGESVRAAEAALEAGKGQEVHAALARAVALLIGDRLSIPPAGMTAADAASVLRAALVPEELVREALEVFERADQARYAAGTETREGQQETIRAVRALLSKLQEALPVGGAR